GTPTAAGARSTDRRREARTRAWARAAGSGLLGLARGRDGRDLERDPDLVADEDATGLEGGVPGEAVLLAGDLGSGGEADAGVAERVGGRAVVLDLEGGGLRHAVD